MPTPAWPGGQDPGATRRDNTCVGTSTQSDLYKGVEGTGAAPVYDRHAARSSVLKTQFSNRFLLMRRDAPV